jgi:hypothetical protein
MREYFFLQAKQAKQVQQAIVRSTPHDGFFVGL